MSEDEIEAATDYDDRGPDDYVVGRPDEFFLVERVTPGYWAHTRWGKRLKRFWFEEATAVDGGRWIFLIRKAKA